MSQTCQRCYKIVHRACQSETEWAECLDRASTLEAALRDMCLAHFPYHNPDDDPSPNRRAFHKRIVAALDGEAYKPLAQ
jgi:hypothetical protein